MVASSSRPQPLLHIHAIQTAMPGKMTPPGQSRRIATATEVPLGHGLLQSRFQVVFYYSNKGGGEDEGEPITMGAWIRESLSVALSSHPEMAGRLRRENGCWEIKFNDCGVRLVQATAEMTMEEFLASEEREGKEGHLAYWVPVDEEEPNFSALFYLQVTQFIGGYSIGISCSLLLADPLFLAQFIKTWAQTQATMLAQGQLTRSPIFHLSYFQRPDNLHRLKSIELVSNPSSTATVLFKVDQMADAKSFSATTAAPYIRQATRRLEMNDVNDYSLIVSNHSGDAKVELSGRATSLNLSDEVILGAQEVDLLDCLGIKEVSLVKGNKPLYVSCRIVSCVREALIVAMLPPNQKLMVSITTMQLV